MVQLIRKISFFLSLERMHFSLGIVFILFSLPALSIKAQESRLAYLPLASGSKAPGGMGGDLVNGEVFCAFEKGSALIYLKNPRAVCMWETDRPDLVKFGSYKGNLKDTVTVAFSTNTAIESVTITVTEEGFPLEASQVQVYLPRKANQAGMISVMAEQGSGVGLVDEMVKMNVYCSGLNYMGYVPADPDFGKYNPDGVDGASLGYRWSVSSSDFGIDGVSSGWLTDEEKMRSQIFQIREGQEGYKWVVRARTCDEDGLLTPTRTRPIEHVVGNEILENPGIVAIRLLEGEDGGKYWDAAGGDAYNHACVFYSEEFNTGENVYEGSLNAGEAGNGYICLQADPYDPQDTVIRNFGYRWIFDEADLEVAEDKMKEKIYADSGFGIDKGRICFKVKDRKDAGTDKIQVSYEVYCKPCQDLAKAQGITGNEYKSVSSPIVLTRVDSLAGKVDYTAYVADNTGVALSGDVPKLCGLTEYNLCNRTDGSSSDLDFSWEIPSDWQLADGGVPGMGGIPYPGGEGNCQAVTTPRVTGDATHFGDTVFLLTYPHNACFQNGNDTSRNARLKLVFLRTVPRKPVLIDPVEKEHPVYTGVEASTDGYGGITMEEVPPVLMCNNNGVKSSPGTLPQSYLLYNELDEIGAWEYNPRDMQKGGYGIILPSTIKTEYSNLLPYSLKKYSDAEKNDTTLLVFTLRAADFGSLKGQTQVPLGVFAANECGPGDTAFFAVNIIDTLSVFAHVADMSDPEDLTRDTVRICEGVLMSWGSGTDYDIADRYKSNWAEPLRNTDRIDYHWELPSYWEFRQASDSLSNPTTVWVGREKGSVSFQFSNRCGLGSKRYSDHVDVDAYTRLKVRAVKDISRLDAPSVDPMSDEFLAKPCQGSTMIYAADTFERTQEYQWVFPSDWTVRTGTGFETARPSATGETNMAYTDNANLNPVYPEMRVQVMVGGDTGFITLIGKKPQCNFDYDNVLPNTGKIPLVRGHHADSLKAVVRPFTSRPVAASPWPGRFCARQEYTLAVMPDPEQDSVTRANTYFSWKFTSDWDKDGFVFKDPDLRDTVTFTVPNKRPGKDTLIVFSHRKDCEMYNEGDSLVFVFDIVDTLSLDANSRFVDLRNPDRPLALNPCEGDTVFYALKGNNSHLDSIWFTWNGSNSFMAGKQDSVDKTGWRVLNRPGRYSDTLKMIVGRNPFVISAQAVSPCGFSSPFSTDSIRPVYLVRDTAGWIRSRIVLCEDEKVVFQHDSVKNATSYAWFYPWGAMTDTVDGYRNVLREFKAGTEFGTGKVYVVPFNACGTGPRSREVEISSIIERLGSPSLKIPAEAPGDEYVFVPVNDTVSDTLCLRTDRRYAASFEHETLGDGVWKFAWFGLELNRPDSLAVLEESADSSQAILFKKAGLDLDYVGVAVRHESCRTYGDTLVLRLQPADTVSVPGSKVISDYLTDLRAIGGKIQLRPCGQDTVHWIFDKEALDPSASDFQFVWSSGKGGAGGRFGREWKEADSTLDGTSFKWFNPKKGEDPGHPENSFYAQDSLYMRVGNGDSLMVAVNVKNRCGVSRLPSVTIKTASVITSKVSLKVKENALFCDFERIVFEAGKNDTVGGYIWHFPWDPGSDTNANALLTFENRQLVPGPVYVVPYNGCGKGPVSDTIRVENIRRVPLRPVPANFDYAYDYAADPVARDSICMRQPLTLKVDFPSGNDPQVVEMEWRMLQGLNTGFSPKADSCVLRQEDVKGEAFSLQVFSRIKGCFRYSDTLAIELFPMDTLAFISRVVEDQVLSPFEVYLPGTVVNVADKEAIDTRPCGYTTQNYTILSDMHWSLSDTAGPYFTWNRPGFPVVSRPDSDLSLGGSDWYYVGDTLEGNARYGNLPLRVGKSDTLLLHVNAANICGLSRSEGLVLVPKKLVSEKPVLQLNSPAVCLGREAEFQTTEPANAETYVWNFPWYPYSDTTQAGWPFLTVGQVGPETGYVIVTPSNTCGNGPSDSLRVENVMQTPGRPYPAWYSGKDYTWNADTVVESVCLHGETLLAVSRDPSDGSDLEFVWQQVGPGAMEILDPLPDQPDSVCRIIPLADAGADGSALLRVWGRYPLCGGAGDTLFIRLYLVDTVSVASLGNLSFTSGEVLDPENPEPCPGSVIDFTVDNPAAAPSYRWTLPSTWEFVGDSVSAPVSVKVGSSDGSVSVAPATSSQVLGCSFVTPHPVVSVLFRPRKAPETSDFDDSFNERPCVGTVEAYTVQETPNAKAYRWEFPSDWKIQEAGAEEDTLWMAGNRTCRVLVGSDSGFVRVYAVDSCSRYAMIGSLVEREVWTVDTARLEILGDSHVCIDSLVPLTVRATNPYADAQRYVLEIRYPGEDKTPVRVTYPSAPDSTYLEVRSANTDTVELVFTPKNVYCPQNAVPFIHYILADTVPDLKGRISGPDTLCEDNLYTFTFHLDTSLYGIRNEVTYRWEVPHSGWKEVSQSDSTVLLHFIRLPEDGAGNPLRHTDTLLCYPRGICGTGRPIAFVAYVRAADPFSDSLMVEDLTPCLGTEVGVRLRDRDVYTDPDSIRFVWNTPPAWTRLDTDSLPETSYRVQFDTASYVKVRMWRKGSCGLSRELSVRVTVRDSASKAVFQTNAAPCYTRETYPVALAPVGDIDSVVWFFRPDIFDVGIYTRSDSPFKYDSVSIDNSAQRTEAFHVVARTVNECGWRDTALLVTPITGITPFEDTLHATRVCVWDTGYVWVALPQGQIRENTVYSWRIGDTANRILQAYVEEDSVAVLKYLSSAGGDTLWAELEAVNDCSSLPALRTEVVPFTFRLELASDPLRGVYGEDGVKLLVRDVEPGAVSDYEYVWMPENRLLPADPVADYRQTGVLVREEETFYVKAVQKTESGNDTLPDYRKDGLCFVSDSVKIAVDSLFAFDPVFPDTVCVDAEHLLSVVSRGGNRDSYRLRWWESLDQGPWTEMPEADDLSDISLTFSRPGEYRYRIIGTDSTVLYASSSGLPEEEPDFDEEVRKGRSTVSAKDDQVVLRTSHSDTVYLDVRVYDLQTVFSNVSSDPVEIPVGGRVEVLPDVEDGSGRYRYSWIPEDLVLEMDSLSGDMKTVALFRSEEMLFAVTDTVSGCRAELALRIRPGNGENIPNTFTPNGDGRNDVFLKGVSRLTIYSRWGEELFFTDKGIGWDGTFKGKTVRPGEYLFVAEILEDDGSLRTYKGVVTVKLR